MADLTAQRRLRIELRQISGGGIDRIGGHRALVGACHLAGGVEPVARRVGHQPGGVVDAVGNAIDHQLAGVIV